MNTDTVQREAFDSMCTREVNAALVGLKDGPESWGFADGYQGKSVYDGYNYFCGAKFLAYESGWKKGYALRVIESWDDGRGSHRLGYSLSSERTKERTAKIIDQVKHAQSDKEFEMAMQAAYMYNSILMSDLAKTYSNKWGIYANN